MYGKAKKSGGKGYSEKGRATVTKNDKKTMTSGMNKNMTMRTSGPNKNVKNYQKV